MTHLQQFLEFINAKAGRSDDRPECPPVELLMIRHNDLAKGIVSSQDNVASFLSFEIEAGLCKGLNAFTSGYSRQIAHTATSRASNLSSGTARLSSSSAAT